MKHWTHGPLYTPLATPIHHSRIRQLFFWVWLERSTLRVSEANVPLKHGAESIPDTGNIYILFSRIVPVYLIFLKLHNMATVCYKRCVKYRIESRTITHNLNWTQSLSIITFIIIRVCCAFTTSKQRKWFHFFFVMVGVCLSCYWTGHAILKNLYNYHTTTSSHYYFLCSRGTENTAWI